MKKGLKKRLIVLSVCLATFYLIPGNGYGQDAPVNDPQTEQADQPQPIGDPQQQTDEKPYKDEVLFGDSTNRFGGGYWDYVKFNSKNGGYTPYSSSGGGDPNVPIDPDEQVPFDGGLIALLAFGLFYGFIQYKRRLKPVVAFEVGNS